MWGEGESLLRGRRNVLCNGLRGLVYLGVLE